MSSALVIRDLTEWPKDGWAVYYPAGSFLSRGKEYFQIADLLIQRASAWTVSQGYESFETFIKDMIAYYLYKNQTEIDLKRFKKKVNHLIKLRLDPTDLIYWKSFVRLAYRNNDQIMDCLRKLEPGIEEVEKKNNRALDLCEWYAVAGEVRHSATHSDMLIKKERMLSWNRQRVKLLNQFFPGTKTDIGYLLKLGQKHTENNLVLFLEYAFGIFKSISKTKNYEWNILKS